MRTGLSSFTRCRWFSMKVLIHRTKRALALRRPLCVHQEN